MLERDDEIARLPNFTLEHRGESARARRDSAPATLYTPEQRGDIAPADFMTERSKETERLRALTLIAARK